MVVVMVLVSVVVVMVVVIGPGPPPHSHNPSTSQGHQDCPSIAHGEQCTSVAACGLPGIATHVLQVLQLLPGAAVLAWRTVVVSVACVVVAMVVVSGPGTDVVVAVDPAAGAHTADRGSKPCC